MIDIILRIVMIVIIGIGIILAAADD